MGHADNSITTLIELASQQENLTGFARILKYIGNIFNATACLLWQLVPYPDIELESPTGRFSVVGHWIRDGSDYASHDLPINSLTGTSIRSGKLISVPATDPRVYKDSLLLNYKIRWICSTPLKLGEGIYGAVNLYRDSHRKFSDDELVLSKKIAKVLPTLYRLIWEKAAFALITRIRDLLESAERSGSPVPSVVEELCKILSKHFSCIESSIFLENHLTHPGEFVFQGGTCEQYLRKSTYNLAEDAGLTVWVLRNKKSVTIFDLAHFARDSDWIQREYPGITWSDSYGIENLTREVLKRRQEDPLPPFCFMAVPVLVGDDILGVIRCCTASCAPYYFSPTDVALLRLVASQLGHFWKARLTREEMESEISSWHNFSDEIQALNVLALAELESEKSDKEKLSKVYQEGLRIAAKLIPETEILDVRLYDPKSNSLYFFVEYGEAWKEGPPQEIEKRKGKKFPIGEGPQECRGAWVYRQNKSYIIPDVTKDELYRSTFPATQSMIIAPISSSDNEKYGVLDLRRATSTQFPRQAESMAVLVGQQLALYHFIVKTIGSLKRMESALKDTLRVQVRSYEDLEHQLRSPIRQAMERLSDYLAGTIPKNRRESYLQAVRGLLGKAFSVVRDINIFKTLHSGERLRIEPIPITEDILIKALIETSADNRLLIGNDYKISSHVNRSSLSVLNDHEVNADLDLLEQALQNVVENAFKYSQPHTVIQISCGIKEKYFFISITNKGIELTEQEIEKVTLRGWRGSLAKSVTSSGSGIGLWLVDHILKAHNGMLEVVPTNPQKMTEFRLLLPISKIKGESGA